MAEASAYPLAWPGGWPRTKQRQAGTYKTSLPRALDNLRSEIRLLWGLAAANSLVLSSNVTLGSYTPADPAVVAYVTHEGEQIAIPCDRWQKVEHNVQAIALTIEAMRAIDRHGAKHMVKAMFRGFTALPPPADWRKILGFGPDDAVLASDVQKRQRQLARTAHPDAGGSHARMAEINAAADAALKEIAAP